MTCDLSIIVVSYNTRELTLACLRSVFEQTSRVSIEVLVVDNNSTDGSAAAIAEEFPQVVLIERSDNLGFAGANNLAAKQAAGQWLLLLNPDTVVLDGAIDTLVQFANHHPDHGIYGGRTLFADGSLNPTSCWRRMTLWSSLCRATGLSSVFRRSRIFDPESLGSWRRDTVRKVDIVTGCFLLIDRRLWAELNGFDESFFMYGEEADLCLRAAKLGARPIICPDATIVHYGGASEPVRADKVVRIFDAKVRLMRKHWSSLAAAGGIELLALWALSRWMVMWIASVLANSSSCRQRATVWRLVWLRRSVWCGESKRSQNMEVSI